MSDFMAKMDAGRERAMRDRNRGIPTGKPAKGHTRKAPAARLTNDEQEAALKVIRERLAREIAADDEMRARYPERYQFFI